MGAQARVVRAAGPQLGAAAADLGAFAAMLMCPQGCQPTPPAVNHFRPAPQAAVRDWYPRHTAVAGANGR
jgi:hypothetical protein